MSHAVRYWTVVLCLVAFLIASTFSAEQAFAQKTLKLKNVKLKMNKLNDLQNVWSLLNLGGKNAYLILVDKAKTGKYVLKRVMVTKKGKTSKYTTLGKFKGRIVDLDAVVNGDTATLLYVVNNKLKGSAPPGFGSNTNSYQAIQVGQSQVQDTQTIFENPNQPMYPGASISGALWLGGVGAFYGYTKPTGETVQTHAYVQGLNWAGQTTVQRTHIPLPDTGVGWLGQSASAIQIGDTLTGTYFLEDWNYVENSQLLGAYAKQTGPGSDLVTGYNNMYSRSAQQYWQVKGVVPSVSSSSACALTRYTDHKTGVKQWNYNVFCFDATGKLISNPVSTDLGIQTPPTIFSDGFESGETSAWSATVPLPPGNDVDAPAGTNFSFIWNRSLTGTKSNPADVSPGEKVYRQDFAIFIINCAGGTSTTYAKARKAFKYDIFQKPVTAIFRKTLWSVHTGYVNNSTDVAMYLALTK